MNFLQVQTVIVDSKCQELVQLLSKVRSKVSAIHSGSVSFRRAGLSFSPSLQRKEGRGVSRGKAAGAGSEERDSWPASALAISGTSHFLHGKLPPRFGAFEASVTD